MNFGDDGDERVTGWGNVIYCSCGNWWRGGDADIWTHMRAHPRHCWWSENGVYDDIPIGPPWPPRLVRGSKN